MKQTKMAMVALKGLMDTIHILKSTLLAHLSYLCTTWHILKKIIILFKILGGSEIL